MELINTVCTLDQAKRLKELGVNKPSLFMWWDFNGVSDPFFHNPPIINYGTNCTAFGSIQSELNECGYPAYTVAELGEMLKGWANSHQGNSMPEYYCDGIVDWWHCDRLIDNKITCETEAQARAAMLIYLLENNLIQP